MANNGKMTTGTRPRSLQYGVDMFIKHFSNQYKGIGEMLFQKVKADKGFYEIVQLAGMGLAARKGEGAEITTDSIDQDWNARFPVYTYEKGARITMEAIEDDVYDDQLSEIMGELVKGLAYNKDYQMAQILNRAFNTSYLGPDQLTLCNTGHTLQAGGTTSNRLAPDLDLSEDAVEQAVILIDNFLNPDGLQSEYVSKKLIVPTALKYVADRIVGSKYRTATSDNDINSIMHRGDVEDYAVWKRLTGNTTWFLTTDCSKSLILAQKKALVTKTFNDPYTFDTIITAHERFRALFADFRGLVGSVGP